MRVTFSDLEQIRIEPIFPTRQAETAACWPPIEPRGNPGMNRPSNNFGTRSGSNLAANRSFSPMSRPANNPARGYGTAGRESRGGRNGAFGGYQPGRSAQMAGNRGRASFGGGGGRSYGGGGGRSFGGGGSWWWRWRRSRWWRWRRESSPMTLAKIKQMIENALDSNSDEAAIPIGQGAMLNATNQDVTVPVGSCLRLFLRHRTVS